MALPITKQPLNAFVIRNGALARATSLSGLDLVKDLSGGGKRKCVYTALRTNPGGKPVGMKIHLERLQSGASSIGISPVPLVEDINQLVGIAAKAVDEASPGSSALVVVALDEQGKLAAHAKAMPARPQPPIKVDIRLVSRAYGDVKDATWIAEREAIKQSPDANEVLLMGPDSSIAEGGSSNFFAVVDDRLQTADQGILKGSIRKIVFGLAKELDIPVDLLAPKWANRDEWQDAFLTSTSRLVLPIDELSDDKGNQLLLERRHPIVNMLTSRMDAAILQAEENANE